MKNLEVGVCKSFSRKSLGSFWGIDFVTVIHFIFLSVLQACSIWVRNVGTFRVFSRLTIRGNVLWIGLRWLAIHKNVFILNTFWKRILKTFCIAQRFENVLQCLQSTKTYSYWIHFCRLQTFLNFWRRDH